MEEVTGLMEKVSDHLTAGRMDEAVATAKSRQTRDLRDAAAHLRWADLLEELGMTDDLIYELNLAIRDDQENKGAYVRLAEIYLDQGQPRRAARVWAQLLKYFPSAGEYYRQYGQALEEAGDYEGAKSVYETGRQRTDDPAFAGLLRNLQFLKGPDEKGEGKASSHTATETDVQAPGAPILPQPHHLVTFLSLFGGREGVYARQWVSPTGESGYTPVEEPLTPKVAENHLLGNFTAGVYPVRMDNTVNFIAFDFDLAKFAVKKAITSQRLWEMAMKKVHQTACRLMDLAAAAEVTVYLEDSGFKGRHVWIFLDSPVPAGVAKKFGDLLAGRLLPLPMEVTVEVFPRQGTVARGGLGNLIKLPLGIHKRTGKPARFIQPDGEPYPEQFSFLTTVKRTSKRAIYAFIQRQFHAPQAGAMKDATAARSELDVMETPPAVPREEMLPWEGPELPETVAALVRQPGRRREFPGETAAFPELAEAYDLERDPQFQAIIARCPVLHAIVEKIHRTAQLSKEETLVLIHTVGHLEQGPEAVNSLFQRVLQADPSLFMKSRLRGNPMSCPKIRARIPAVTSAVSCNCAFELGTNLYPTPIIHVRGVTAESFSQPLGLSADSLQFQNLLQEYVKLRKQQREIMILMAQYEKKLDQFFDETGMDAVQTPLGELRRRKGEGEKTSFTLEI